MSASSPKPQKGREAGVSLRGLSFIGFERGAAGPRTFRAEDPSTRQPLPPVFHAASDRDVARACELADQAADPYGDTSASERAVFLRTIAEGLEAEGAAIVACAHAETGLPLPRLQSELARTAFQLRLFARVIEDGTWLAARIDPGDPERKPLPKPDVRSLRIPLGPVVVFGASNFPLAFSVAGGDTASALAAGNPVIVKAHPAHPGTSEHAGAVIAAAVRSCGLPEGTFSLLFDDGFTVGQALVQHPQVAAVGFTGSRAGGEALMRLAANRPCPIPVYAEMGSVNPVILLPGALRERGPSIAEGLHASFTLGTGQFCTKPGVVFAQAGEAIDASFLAPLAERTRATAAGAMLTARMAAAYWQGLERMRSLGASLLAQGTAGAYASSGEAALWQVDGAAVLREPRLVEEVFGPSMLLVRYRDADELLALLRSLEGQLTATIHAQPDEVASAAPLVRLLARKVGRVVFNQFPTGVEVGPAMVHGGPFPATSDGRSTSVGTHAIDRFSRLVAYQNAPHEVLPAELVRSEKRTST
ncbi:aldehyde dehydrogenase (NADP(+)) [Pendulispora albinea]|uniref:Aldehyde dehydrogenase (NADP(+)) n=1 Tax=Pendulispora albinea TaxID=2741071 RepID=A0ABZ2M5X1_9BACT